MCSSSSSFNMCALASHCLLGGTSLIVAECQDFRLCKHALQRFEFTCRVLVERLLNLAWERFRAVARSFHLNDVPILVGMAGGSRYEIDPQSCIQATPAVARSAGEDFSVWPQSGLVHLIAPVIRPRKLTSESGQPHSGQGRSSGRFQDLKSQAGS